MEIKKKRKCHFCGKMMGYVCKCGAYQVSDETYNLPLKEQPYMSLQLQFSGELMTVINRLTELEYREYLKKYDDINVDDIIARLKAKKMFR